MRTGPLLQVRDVVPLLAFHLGPGRQWVDTLNDFRQERGPGLKGHVLMPAQYTEGTPTRAGRPLYAAKDVTAFIRAVRDAYGVRQPFQRKLVTYLYDDTAGIMASMRRPAVPVP